MNSRRQILAAFGAGVLAAPLAGFAQTAAPKLFRIGWVSLGKSDAPSPFLDAFRQGLKESGYVEGRSVVIDARSADGSRERADQMVAALVQSKVDVIVTQGGAAWSAYRYAGTTPVVMGYSGDPVEAKFVDRILKGTKPADLPVELPTSVEFVINAKTAKAIGIKIPQAMYLRATGSSNRAAAIGAASGVRPSGH